MGSRKQKPKRHLKSRNYKFSPTGRCARCGKLSYRSESAANRAIRTRGGERAYMCPHHRGIWHVTTKPYREITQVPADNGEPPASS